MWATSARAHLTGLSSLARGHALDGSAAVIVVGSLLVRAWALHRTWFWQDDFVIAADAREQGLTSQYLLQDYNGHLMPAKFLVVWAAEELAPLQWGVPVMSVLLLSLLAGAAFWILLKTLFGPRHVLLLPLAVMVLCPIGTVSYTWWASALESLPLQIGMAATLTAHVRHLRGGGGSWRAGALLSFGLSLLWIEKALLILVVVAWADVLFRRRATASLRSRLMVWAGYLLVTAGHLAVYTTLVARPTDPAPSVSAVVSFGYDSLLSLLPVGLLGGSWLQPADSSTLQPIVTQPWLLLVWVVVLLVGYASFRVSGRRALRGWSLALVYLVVDAGLVAATRLDFLGPVIGRDPRYLADAVPVVVLAVTAAFLPIVGLDPGRVKPQRPRSLQETRVARAVWLLVVAYLCSSWITTYQVAEARGATGAREWVGQARAELAGDPEAIVYDALVPDFVVAGFFGQYARASSVLAGVVPGSRFNQPTLDLRVLDGQGHLRTTKPVVELASGPGPLPGCGWLVDGRPATVRLPGRLGPSDWEVRVGYYAAQATRPRLDVGSARWTVALPAGLHVLSLFPSGPVDSLRVSGLDVGEKLCVTDVTVGRPWPQEPAPGTSARTP